MLRVRGGWGWGGGDGDTRTPVHCLLSSLLFPPCFHLTLRPFIHPSKPPSGENNGSSVLHILFLRIYTSRVCLSEACVEAARPCVRWKLEGGSANLFCLLGDGGSGGPALPLLFCSCHEREASLICRLDQRNHTQPDEAEAPQRFLEECGPLLCSFLCTRLF